MLSVSNENAAPVAFFLPRVDDAPRVPLDRADFQHTDPKRHGLRNYVGERPELIQILKKKNINDFKRTKTYHYNSLKKYMIRFSLKNLLINWSQFSFRLGEFYKLSTYPQVLFTCVIIVFIFSCIIPSPSCLYFCCHLIIVTLFHTIYFITDNTRKTTPG